MVVSKLASKISCLVTLVSVLACLQGCAVEPPEEPVTTTAQAELVPGPDADAPDETGLTSDSGETGLTSGSDTTLSACWDEYACFGTQAFGRFCCGIAPGAPGTVCSTWRVIPELACK